MKQETKEKSLIIQLLEFIACFAVVLGFLAGMFYFAKTEKLERLLFSALIFTIVIIGAWYRKK